VENTLPKLGREKQARFFYFTFFIFGNVMRIIFRKETALGNIFDSSRHSPSRVKKSYEGYTHVALPS